MMALQELADRLNASRNVVFFTGAGISTESGVPDFRSPGGIWTRYSPVYFSDFLHSEEAQVRYWKMKKETHELYKGVQPNIGHDSIVQWEKKGHLLGLITQNVDGLHQLAGLPAAKVVELHGTDRKVGCLSCGREFDPAPIYEAIAGNFRPPRCDRCGGLLKAATISFGQQMPAAAMERAHEWSRAAEIFIVAGSSLVVQPAALFPVVARQSGALLAIVNRDPTPQDALASFRWDGGIGDFFRELNPRVGIS